MGEGEVNGVETASHAVHCMIFVQLSDKLKVEGRNMTQ